MKKLKKIALLLMLSTYTLTGMSQDVAAFGIVGRAAMETINLKDFNESIVNSTEILNKTTVISSFYYDKKNKPIIYNEDKSFVLQFRPDDGEIRFKEGALLLGYFTREIGKTVVNTKNGLASVIPSDPEAIARMYTQYLLIKKVESLGGDLLLEPIVSTDVSVVNKDTDKITVKISTKAIKIKSSK